MNNGKENSCVSCGNAFNGRFCNRCGEKVVLRTEQTFRHFLGELINAFTFADTKLWLSLKTLFLKPGILPRHHIQGQRKAYIAPLSLFLLINLIYFLFSPFDTFNSFFTSQLNYQPYSDIIREYGLEVMKQSSLEESEFVARYNARSINISKSIIVLLPVLLSFPLFGLFYKRSTYIFDHLMFSISFMSFVLLGVFLLLPGIIIGLLHIAAWFGATFNVDWNGGIASLLLFATIGSYFFIGLRNFYRERFMTTLLKTIILLVCLTFLMFFYRFILFFLTLWTI